MKVTTEVLVVLMSFVAQVLGTIGNKSRSKQQQLFSDFSSTCEYRDRDFVLITRSLVKGLNFFGENVENLVLDAGVGTTILERQLGVILDEKAHLSKQVRIILRRLMEKARSISDKLIDLNRTKVTKNLSLPWMTTEALWRTPKIGQWKKLRKNQLLTSFHAMVVTREVLDEDISDRCIGALFENCDIPHNCWKLFLGRLYTRYSLTHQMIYYHIADQICIDKPGFLLRNSGAWKKRLRMLCSKILSEAISIENESFPGKFQDLFAEEVVVCSIGGFQDFIRPNWTYQLLLWQKELSDDLACFQHQVHENGKYSNRQKRSDVSIVYDLAKCSVHFSAVGMAALGIHLRYFLENCA